MIEVRAHTVGPASLKETGWIRTVAPIYDFAQKTSPCREGCPAGHDISWALNLIRNNDFEGANRLFREESPFPSITGRVCYHPCESVCNRKDHDEPLAINDLERAMSEYGEYDATVCERQYSEPVAVIGSGPSGLTVAYHLTRFGYPVTVFERHSQIGGALRYGIPDYRLPAELLDAEAERLEKMGITFQTNTAIGQGDAEVAWDSLRDEFSAVYLGIGLSRGRKLTIPGIESIDAKPGLAFLHAVNSGEIVELEGEVMVIGSGDVAMDVARSAKRLGATEVHILCLEDREHMTCHPAEITEALDEGLTLHTERSATEISVGEKISVKFANVTAIEDGFRPVLGDETMTLSVDHFLYAVGQEPNAPFLPQEIFGDNGKITIDGAGQTYIEGVFAGGDIAGTYNVVQSIGAGKRAAVGIDCFLRERDVGPLLKRAAVGGDGAISITRYISLLDQPDEQPSLGAKETVMRPEIDLERTRLTDGAAGVEDVVLIDRINMDYFPKADRSDSSELPVQERNGFAEVGLSLGRKEAITEASRCFHCSECTMCGNCFDFCPDSAVVQKGIDGFFMIDDDHCKGCGTCVVECPRSAMSMVPEQEFQKWTV